jgi:NAD-dependent SIR2 family protein deacetylase
LHDNGAICEDAERLARFLRNQSRITVLTGAGCSTASGIPEYRDDDGNWKHRKPMQFADFVGSEKNRQRYWAQSFAGWKRISSARPNAAHQAITSLERSGLVSCVITQNVDNLHRTSGCRNVIDLHGVLDRVECLDCGKTDSRQTYQSKLRDLNPDWEAKITGISPDGDARLSIDDFRSFQIPACAYCAGTVKPNVVFFGESVPAARVARARKSLSQSDALLVIGSSLMVFSGYRFARIASEAGKPIAIVNRGTTRADHLATHKLTTDCSGLLPRTVARLLA